MPARRASNAARKLLGRSTARSHEARRSRADRGKTRALPRAQPELAGRTVMMRSSQGVPSMRGLRLRRMRAVMRAWGYRPRRARSVGVAMTVSPNQVGITISTRAQGWGSGLRAMDQT